MSVVVTLGRNGPLSLRLTPLVIEKPGVHAIVLKMVRKMLGRVFAFVACAKSPPGLARLCINGRLTPLTPVPPCPMATDHTTSAVPWNVLICPDDGVCVFAGLGLPSDRKT